jgi:hypothetical protein
MVEGVGEGGTSGLGTILIEERPDGKPGQVLFVLDDGTQGEQLELMRTFRVVSLLNPSGRLGITTPDGRFEVGVNAGMYTPEKLFPLLGSYVRVAPLSGDVGRRIYAHGAIFWGYTVTVTEVGVGYRHITDDNAWEKRFWFVELSLLEEFGEQVCSKSACDKTRDLTPIVTVGFTWK